MNPRLFVLILALPSVGFFLSACRSTAPGTAPHREYSTETELTPLIEGIRQKHDLPALAAAVIVDGDLHAVGVSGVRKTGSGVEVTESDPFHIGSCTKAMTATLLAMLVERERLRWDSTLAELFPDLTDEMLPVYQDVTLEHLLAHRAGLPGANESWPKGMTFQDMHELPGPSRAQRTAYIRMILSQAPQAAPGEKYIYSNAGYAIAGAMAERVMDEEWEELMSRLIFGPLGMATAGFGSMGTEGELDAPWQHRLVFGLRTAVGPGRFSDNPPAIGPAGTVHCSIRDWAKFVLIHLEGERGKHGLLEPETFQRLHRPPFGGTYASGWGVYERDWGGGRVLNHAGSNNQNFCVVWVAPLRNFAVLVATNQGGERADTACDEAAWTLIETYLLGSESR